MQETDATVAGLFKEHREALVELEQKIPDIIKMRDVLLELKARDGSLLLCGNGGSATAHIQEMHEFTMHVLCELIDRRL